ncbi:MAG: hypothetical protein A3E31_03085 [Candidatus Rokubacteria bacterium RIFCSPHIGHO2_12_FULL_73_22]|nr:MAG: hypothetical protein A3E31_03085 [Candidatus Rokubacteria bacterium RIFCSPHIGHO2_12_FULL_73_22]
MTRALATLTALASLLALALACPPPAPAQLTKAGVVTTLQGTATVVRATTKESLPLRFKDAVFVHDRITTGDASVARILLGGKAIVTVRERSVLTLTEAPGASTLNVSIGRVALAVVKERMKPGESIDIRTPNAVAGIRGTVVITEVDQTTAQAGPIRGAAFTTTFTVLQGVVRVTQYDPGQRRTFGAVITLGPAQRTLITGATAPRPAQTLPPDVLRGLSDDYRLRVKEAPTAVNATLASTQVGEALGHLGSLQGVKPAAGLPSSGAGAGVKGSDAPEGAAGSGTGTSGVTGGAATSGPAGGASGSGTASGAAAGTPTVSAPAVSAPPVSVPSVSVPTLGMPTVSLPTGTVAGGGSQVGAGSSGPKGPSGILNAIQELQKQKKFRKKKND